VSDEEQDMEIVAAALRKMKDGGHFSICTIRKCAEVLDVTIPQHVETRLSALHCVDFGAMSPSLLKALGDLIQAALSGPRFDFSTTNILPAPKRKAWRLLG
jgi:hypothetical protein